MPKETLKSLTTKRTKLITKLKKLSTDMSTNTKALNEIEQKLKDLTVTVQISEHAVLRYLERYKGLDVEEIKKEILPNEEWLNSILNKSEDTKIALIKIGDHRLEIKDNVIVTVK